MRKKKLKGKQVCAWMLTLSMLFSAALPGYAVHAQEEAVGVQEAVPVTGDLKESPSGADLTTEGTLDWVQLDTKDYQDYNRKNIEAPLIRDVTREQVNHADERYSPTDTLYSFTDGTRTQKGTSNASLVMVNEGAALEFTLPGSRDRRYVKIYTGAWASDLKLTVSVNGEEAYTETYSQPEPSKSGRSMTFDLQYQTESEGDEVRVRIEITKTYSSGGYNGNASVQAVTLSDRLQREEKISTEDWEISFGGGSITEMKARIGEEMVSIPMNAGANKLQWLWNGSPVLLTQAEEAGSDKESPVYAGSFQEEGTDISFRLQYCIDEDKNLVIRTEMKNNGDAEAAPESASLNLGFNTYLANYPDYEEQLFPTLLRCEKTHLWGYFSSPSGKIMTIATDHPVASYTLNYQSGLHRIYGASLDMLHQGPLPERHPENCGSIAAGETKTWNIYLKPMENIRAYEKVKESLAGSTAIPVIDADHYTVAAGEASNIRILSATPVTVEYETPDGTKGTLETEKAVDQEYLCTLKPEEEGVYKIYVSNGDGYRAEAMISCRMPWSWYMQKARQAAIDAPQKGSTHIESYVGLYTGYLTRKYFPDAEADMAIDEKLDEIYPLMYSEETGLPTVEAERIQNHSGMMGILVDKYQASGDREALEKAEILAGHLLSRQKADGGYYSGNTDYTSVIYPAKSIMELMYVEKALMEDEDLSPEERETWKSRYDTHMASVTRAMDNLVERDGALETEGQGTFEDGANSCSYTQLSEFALMFPEGSAERKKYTDSALAYLNRHVSHQQLLVPDSRMNGGTLRFWEAQYDVEMGLTAEAPNMMNSPHGWTAWSIYGYFNLYQLTGNEEYLRRGMNALGSCAQLMSFDGKLRWAFVPDPYRSTNLFVYDEENSVDGKIAGKHVSTILGEQYVDMISTWWRAPANTLVNGYQAMNWYEKQGSACDNDVHEIFKCMAEVALTRAYVAEKADGTLDVYNCTAERTADGIRIVPEEEVVSNVSVKLKESSQVTVQFYDGDQTANVEAGEYPVWITTKENCTDVANTDRNSGLSKLEVSQGTLVPEFSPEVTEYTLKLRPDAEEAVITPAAAGEHASVRAEGSFLKAGESLTVDAAENNVDKTVEIKGVSENLATTTSYRIRILKGSINKNIAGDASEITAEKATGDNRDTKALVDGKKDDHADGTTITLETSCPQTIEFRWEEPRSLSGTALWAWYAKSQAPVKWDIQITRDGENWEDAAQVEDAGWQYSDSRLESYRTEFPEVKDAVGLRYVIREGNTVWGHFAVNEIEIYTKEAITDSSRLQQKLTEAEGLEQEDYTEESWEIFRTELEEARNVLENGLSPQESLDAACESLENAEKNLIRKPEPTPGPTLEEELQKAQEALKRAQDDLEKKAAELTAAENRLAEVQEKAAALEDEIIAAKDEAAKARQEAESAKKEKEDAAKKELELLEESRKKAIKSGDKEEVGSVIYRVTDAEQNLAEAYGVIKADSKTVKVADTVVINGVTCKVTSIANNAFKSLTKLKKVVIGKNVVTIGKKVFYGDKNLRTIQVKGTVLKKVGKNALKGIHAKAVIKVPKNKKKVYTKIFKSRGQKKTVKVK